ncbi:MAG TPA: S4 domain-containing protein, partial [Candidatus Saccharimonadales bacterium]|nr:S4 domain-containing protein [Candidatus Saccharimonadales bacterium]
LDEQRKDPQQRVAQTRLAREVTALVHGKEEMEYAQKVTGYLTGSSDIGKADRELEAIRKEIPAVKANKEGSIVEALAKSGLAGSNSEARRLLASGAVYVNGQKTGRENFEAGDFQNGRLMLRRGKAFKDSALVEL